MKKLTLLYWAVSLVHLGGHSVQANNEAPLEGMDKKLHQLVHKNDIEALRALIQQAGNLNIRTSLRRHLLTCAISGDISAPKDPLKLHAFLKVLLQWPGIEVNQKDNHGFPPLVILANTNNVAGVHLFLKNGADPNAVDANGRGALMWAAHEGHEEVVTLLLKQPKIKLNTLSNLGESALLEAAGAGRNSMVQKLLQAGAKVDVQGAHLYTPLMAAAQSGHLEVVKLLLQHRADVTKQNEHGHTAVDEARVNGHKEVYELLKAKFDSAGRTILL